MICDACETSNNDDAQYCKGCGRLITPAGTILDPTVTPQPPVSPPPPPPIVPPPLEPTQLIQANQPIPAADRHGVPPTRGVPANPPPPAETQNPPAWPFVLGGIAIGALLLLMVTMFMGNDGNSTVESTAGSTANVVETIVQTTLSETTTTTTVATTAPPTPSIDPFFGSAVAIFASIPKADATMEDAQQRATAIATATGADVRVIDSDRFGSLRDGFWVVAEGNYASPDEAASRCWALGLQSSNECYGRQISDDPADIDGTVFPKP